MYIISTKSKNKLLKEFISYFNRKFMRDSEEEDKNWVEYYYLTKLIEYIETLEENGGKTNENFK